MAKKKRTLKKKRTPKKKGTLKKARTLKPQQPIELDRLLTEELLRKVGLSSLAVNESGDPELETLVSEVRKRSGSARKSPSPKSAKISAGTIGRLAR
jgi:hypothetical protein